MSAVDDFLIGRRRRSAFAPVRPLHKAYVTWCEAHGNPVLPEPAFRAALLSLGYVQRRDRGGMQWRGLNLRTREDEEATTAGEEAAYWEAHNLRMEKLGAERYAAATEDERRRAMMASLYVRYEGDGPRWLWYKKQDEEKDAPDQYDDWHTEADALMARADAEEAAAVIARRAAARATARLEWETDRPDQAWDGALWDENNPPD